MTHSAFWAFNGGKSGMDWTTAWIFVILGAACIIINYEADVQRQVARETSGNCLIWGKKPRMIQAKYTTKDGTETSRDRPRPSREALERLHLPSAR